MKTIENMSDHELVAEIIETESLESVSKFELSDCPQLLQDLVNYTEPCSFQDLAFSNLGEYLLNASGEDRKPTQRESAVIITDELKSRVQDLGSGLAVMDGRQHLYLNAHWSYVDPTITTKVIGGFAERLGHNVADSRYHKIREDFAKQLACGSMPLKRADNKMSINFSNGTLDFNDGTTNLRQHKKADGFTYVLPFDYDEEATCPLFDRYLARVLPDEESRILLSEFYGYTFMRNLKLEKILILLGHGHNGKSVMFDVMSAMMGEENISNLGLGALNKSETRTPLLGKLLNYGSEITGSVSPDTFKRLASGEPIDFRYLYGDLFTSENYARLAFNANVLPQDVEFTDAFFRRFIIIPFDQKITEAEKDPELASKIISSELSGVMNWVLRGLDRVRCNKKFSPSLKSDKCLAEYRVESDTVALFLEEEGYSASTTEKIKQSVVYCAYSGYCREGGFRALSKKNFKQRMISTHKIDDGRDGNIGRYFKCSQSEIGV
jgi:putative DNA primase/helicase